MCFALFIFTIFIIYLLNWLNKKNLFSTPDKHSCRLVWAPFKRLIETDYSRLLFIIFLFFYFGLCGYASGGYSLLFGKFFEGWIKYPIRYLVLPFTFFIALFICFFVNGINYVDIFGSFWCFLAVAFGITSCLHI
jgi:hypothetical protein